MGFSLHFSPWSRFCLEYYKLGSQDHMNNRSDLPLTYCPWCIYERNGLGCIGRDIE